MLHLSRCNVMTCRELLFSYLFLLLLRIVQNWQHTEARELVSFQLRFRGVNYDSPRKKTETGKFLYCQSKICQSSFFIVSFTCKFWRDGVLLNYRVYSFYTSQKKKFKFATSDIVVCLLLLRAHIFCGVVTCQGQNRLARGFELGKQQGRIWGTNPLFSISQY